MMTDPAADGRKRIGLPYDGHGLFYFTLGKGNDIARDVHMDRAGLFAGRHFIHHRPAFFPMNLGKVHGLFFRFITHANLLLDVKMLAVDFKNGPPRLSRESSPPNKGSFRLGGP